MELLVGGVLDGEALDECGRLDDGSAELADAGVDGRFVDGLAVGLDAAAVNVRAGVDPQVGFTSGPGQAGVAVFGGNTSADV